MSSDKNSTKLLPCNCTHAYQDAKYGQGLRVHNAYLKPSPGGFRCTVCDRNK